jgi:ribonuclease P protein component
MLPKKQRLPIQLFVGKKGKLAKSPFFLIKIYSASEKFSRFGVTISAKVAKKATARNRMKRLAYNFLRDYYKEIPLGDYWITVLPSAAQLDKENFKKKLWEAFST